MQNISINDAFSDRKNLVTEGIINHAATGEGKAEAKKTGNASIPLRDINLEQPFYMQKDLKDKTAAEKLGSQLNSGQSGLAMKNSMVLAASGMTKQDFSRMEEDGFSPMDMEDEAIVTVADQIRIQMAKGGADISMMGDISKAAIESVSGGAAAAKSIENAIKKAGEISEISETAKSYLIKNELEPTIDNVYRANFSISDKFEYSGVNKGEKSLSEEELNSLKPQMEAVINKAGLGVTEESLEGAKWLLNNKLPLTPENLKEYLALSGNEIISDKDEIKASINEAVAEGKNPDDAYILKGFNTSDIVVETEKMLGEITDTKLQNAVKNNTSLTISAISTESDVPNKAVSIEKGSRQEYELVSARRNLEEIRLSMTFEVSVSMVRRGISIDTTSLSDLVDRLKEQENMLFKALLSGGNESVSLQDKINIFETTNNSLNSLKTAPAAVLGSFSSVSSITIQSLTVESTKVSASFKNVEASYEALMTAPRKDMGDSIKKAFRNVDDILKDLGFETTQSNQRAVRILGYNSLSITRESVLNMRQADELVQKTFKNLTPGVVAKMVKEGENPLDMNLEELNKKIDKIRESDFQTSPEEDYAEFLYKLDRQNGLSEEERNGFIGIYRLMHQVTQSDGAVIGALLNQGAEVTMRNMMTAIRSNRHKNREAVIDDNFGAISGFKKENLNLSITQQIEMAFQTSRMEDAKREVTPSKLAEFDMENQLLEMTPDMLAQALEAMDENPDDEAAYVEESLKYLNESVTIQSKVYEALRQFDIPTTPAYIRAMDEFLSDRNNVYNKMFNNRKPFSNAVSREDLEDINPREIMAELIRRFGEACKTPKDMADAQQTLAETATNVMRDMMVEREVGYVDVRGMKVAMTQVQMLGRIAQDAENYTLPIMVADETGTLNLKIVRGSKENNGLVDIAFNTDTTGPVNASFKYTAEGVSGSIACVKDNINNILKGMETTLENTIAEITETSVSISFGVERTMTGESIYADKDPGFETTREQNSIQTEKLYGIAKTFIDLLGEIKF